MEAKSGSMFEQPVVFVDLETTGGRAGHSRIIEVAAIRLEVDGSTQTYQTLIHPGSEIPFFITQITGISDRDVEDSPEFAAIAGDLHKFLAGAIFIAHNVRFDYSFLKAEFESCGFCFDPELRCTVRLSRALYSEHPKHSLETIIHRHGLVVEARHRAYADTKAIFDFAKLAYDEHGHEKFHFAFHQQKKRQTLPPNLDEAQLKRLKNTTGVYIFEDEQHRPLYVGKSVKLRSRVLSHFASDTKVHREMRLSQQVRHIRTIETASELEALLLESELVKELMPTHNRRLRKKKSLLVLHREENEAGYFQVQIKRLGDIDPQNLLSSYGIFPSLAAAKSFLIEAQGRLQLCPKLLGLEKGRHGCFSFQLKKCHGACVGEESPVAYNIRVVEALADSKFIDWPFDGPILMAPKKTTVTRAIVIDQWTVRGFANAEFDGAICFEEKKFDFDLDAYKIIKKSLTTDRRKFKIVDYDFGSAPNGLT